MRAPLHVTQQHGADALVAKETEHKGPHVAVEHADLSGDVVGAEDAHEGGRVPNLEAALLLLQDMSVQLCVQRHDEVLPD